MDELLKNPEFWKAITSLAWPAVALVVFWTLKGRIFSLFTRENLTIKVAGFELNVADTAKKTGEEVVDLQKKLAQMEEKLLSFTGNKSSSRSAIKMSATAKATFRQSGNFARLDEPALSHGLSILWVDDFPSNNAFIVEDFEKRGFSVQQTKSTQDSLLKLLRQRFDIVISDLGRKEDEKNNPLAGLELIRAIRAEDKTTPILIFSGPRALGLKTKLLSEGATDVTDSAIDVQRFVLRIMRKKLVAISSDR